VGSGPSRSLLDYRHIDLSWRPARRNFRWLSRLIVGALLGSAAGVALRHFVIGNLQVAQSQLLDSTFAVMGAICKADNVVTRDEINAVEQMFGMLKLQDEQRQQARAAFDRGKLASRGLPDSMRAVAEERSREINSAYNLIKSSRGFV
jgi:Spy/CpxP family protein refolding chaperone